MESADRQAGQPAEPESTDDLRSPRWRRSEDQRTLSDAGRAEDLDREIERSSLGARWLKRFTGSLNFYRIHLLTFTFVSSTQVAITTSISR